MRSARRRRTVQARVVDGKLRVSIPAAMSATEEHHWVEEMVRRLSRRAATDEIDLTERAEALGRRHRLPAPASIRWVDNQQARWGSCTPADGTVRISARLAAFPPWVLDYVIVHELAHLVEVGHGPAFKALERRFSRAERAIGFLMAKGLDGDEVRRPPTPREGALPLPGI